MFFDILDINPQQYAIITPEQSYTYKQLYEMTKHYQLRSTNKELVLLLCDNSVDIIAAYIAVMKSKHAIMLLSSLTNKELLQKIVATYQPKWIITIKDFEFSGYEKKGRVHERNSELVASLHPDLALLLSTSGTTGSNKFVRLSYDNLQSNAAAIVKHLEIDESERGVLNLPLSYSYGMSILNSHLQVGATVLLTEESVMAKSFWSFVKQQKATSLPGVPFTYQMLQRIGFLQMELPHLKTLTQAGGRLDERLVRQFGSYAQEKNKRFFVMYGQTEAAPRISYVPSSRVLDKPCSIGVSIPEGKLDLDSETGELIYRGGNVMMGYAECTTDLAKGDECNGILHTGDVAIVDEEGYFTIIGRMKRFIKLFGLRINLDEVEKKLEANLRQPIACIGSDDQLLIATEDVELIDTIKSQIDVLYRLHRSSYKVVVLPELPRMANGKINYQALKDE